MRMRERVNWVEPVPGKTELDGIPSRSACWLCGRRKDTEKSAFGGEQELEGIVASFFVKWEVRSIF